MARISALIPTYNRARLLERGVRSALSQTHPPFEVIVVDDGSTDDTRSLLDRLRQGHPEVRPVYQSPNRGPSAARNRCLAEARGDLVAFLDSDDLWQPDHLQRCLQFLEDAPDLDVVFGDLDHVSPDGGVLKPRHLWNNLGIGRFLVPEADHPDRYRFRVPENEAFFHENLVRLQASVIRRAALTAFSFDESLRVGEDWDFFHRLARAGRRFGFSNRVHCRLVVHEGNLLSNAQNPVLEAQEVAKMWRRLLADPTVTAAQRRTLRRQISRLHFDEGYSLTVEGKRVRAAGAFSRSLRMRWSWRALKGLLVACLVPAPLLGWRRRRAERPDALTAGRPAAPR